VVYFSGHGVGIGDTYYYLTQEARSTDLSDAAIRDQAAVSSEELVEWLKQSPALKQVMVLDTCAAGTAALKLVEQRTISSDQIGRSSGSRTARISYIDGQRRRRGQL